MRKRPTLRIESLSRISRKRLDDIVARSTVKSVEVAESTARIVEDVRRNGDAALRKYTKRFDKVDIPPSRIRVSKGEVRRAFDRVSREDPDLIPAIRAMLECVWNYHEHELAQMKRKPSGWQGEIRSNLWPEGQHLNVGQIRTPLNRAGVYVPGGNAVLLSTAVMAITPAKVAGVPEVVLASPPSRNGDIAPEVLVAADLAGADLIVRVGGPQAIAGMAYGTRKIPRVDKIVGPGNIHVLAAKCHVAAAGACGIDIPAGPSEILVLADETADPDYVARDMLSQAEHDENASALLVTTSRHLAQTVRKKILAEFGSTKKASIAERSMIRYGAFLVADDLQQAVAFANYFAPEHLEIVTKDPRSLLPRVRNAGGIFLGPYSAVAVGDYVCPNHILPTGGAARFASGMSVDTFIKKPSVLEVPKETAWTINRMVETLSKAEGLYEQHGRAVRARTEKQ
jgi:histidinol dehydrogenase